MQNHRTALCLWAMILFLCLSCTGHAEPADTNGLHRYQDIPFTDINAAEIAQIIPEITGDPFEISQNVWSGESRGIEDFGYTWNLYVDFYDNYTDINRVFLESAENGWGRGDAFRTLIRRDTLQFIDLEAQLIRRYGEPDLRFFYTDARNYNLKGFTEFMFPGGVWDAEQIMAVCETDRYIVAFSRWGNVTIQLWVNWLEECKPGYLTRLGLYFLDKLPEPGEHIIMDYPPVDAKPSSGN